MSKIGKWFMYFIKDKKTGQVVVNRMALNENDIVILRVPVVLREEDKIKKAEELERQLKQSGYNNRVIVLSTSEYIMTAGKHMFK